MTDSREFGSFFTKELQNLKQELTQQFKAERWTEVAIHLDTLAKIGEGYGQKELCLRAQSLREIMGHRGSGRQAAGDRMMELFDQLMFYVSHLQWKNQTNH